MLTRFKVPWAVATTGQEKDARQAVNLLEIDSPLQLVTRDDVSHGKPFPDLFLAAAERLHVDISNCIVVGDSVWDLLASRRAHVLVVVLFSGGYGEDELERPGAYRVYADPAELSRHIDELGVEAACERTHLCVPLCPVVVKSWAECSPARSAWTMKKKAIAAPVP